MMRLVLFTTPEGKSVAVNPEKVTTVKELEPSTRGSRISFDHSYEDVTATVKDARSRLTA